MFVTTFNISESVLRLRGRVPLTIHLLGKWYTDEQMAELIDRLLAHPNVVTRLHLDNNRLTDKTGVKLARYVAASSTIDELTISNNQFGLATYLTLAAALRVNTSLRILYIYDYQVMNRNRIDCINAAFMDALLLNPNRPFESSWWLYSWNQNEFPRLKRTAEELGHPNMQSLLAMIIY